MTQSLSYDGAGLYLYYIIFIVFGWLCFRTSFSDDPFCLYTIIIITRAYSRIPAGSEVELTTSSR